MSQSHDGQRDDGGPAFPIENRPVDFPGMTLRDYFAGQALVGMLTNPIYDNNTTRNVAQVAYMTADAMIAERQR